MTSAEKKPRVSAIAAIGRKRELGKNGSLVWRIPEDLERVKALTMGHPIIMGRKTFASIGRPLPGRTNMVVTTSNVCIDGCLTYDTPEKALNAARTIDTEEVFIFGGAQLYEATLPITDRLYLTVIDAEDPAADAHFPDYSVFTKELAREMRTHDGLTFTWLTLERG